MRWTGLNSISQLHVTAARRFHHHDGFSTFVAKRKKKTSRTRRKMKTSSTRIWGDQIMWSLPPLLVNRRSKTFQFTGLWLCCFRGMIVAILVALYEPGHWQENCVILESKTVVLAFLIANPVPRSRPKTCKDLKQQSQVYMRDGQYQIYPLKDCNTSVSVYCRHMWSNNPKEYLTVRDGNFVLDWRGTTIFQKVCFNVLFLIMICLSFSRWLTRTKFCINNIFSK